MLSSEPNHAVIFDMDGVLIDSELFWRQALVEVLREEVNVELTDQLCAKTMGLRIDEVVNFWYRYSPWETPERTQIEQMIVARVITLIESQGKAKPGVYQVLDFLSNQEYVSLALASSSSYKVIYSVLNLLGIRDIFQVICSGMDEEYGKPHPSIYISTAKKLKLAPIDCLAIEDSLNGVLAAKAARMQCVAVPVGYPRYDPKFMIADQVVGSLLDIQFELLNAS